MNIFTIHEHWTAETIRSAKLFFDKHLSNKEHPAHASTILVGLLQMMRNNKTYQNILDGKNPYSSNSDNLKTCLILLIPDEKAKAHTLRFCTLSKTPAGHVHPSFKNSTEKHIDAHVSKNILLPTQEEITIEYVKDVMHCEQVESGLILGMQDKTIRCAGKSIDDIEKLFSGEKFIRTDDNHLINLEHICKYYTQNGLLLLKDGSKLRMAKDRHEYFLRTLMQHGLNKKSTYGSRSYKKYIS